MSGASVCMNWRERADVTVKSEERREYLRPGKEALGPAKDGEEGDCQG